MADISKISPDNGTTIYNLKDIEARKRVPEVLLKDTVGWTGKNLIRHPYSETSVTKNGVNFTYNATDGSVTLQGTATAAIDYYLFPHNTQYPYRQEFLKRKDLVLSGGYSDSIFLSFWNIDGLGAAAQSKGSERAFSFTNENANFNCVIHVNNETVISEPITIHPMLRDASITDDTFEPYHESVEEVVGDIRAEQRVLGAKNLCESRCPTSTSYGITCTKNNDGSYTISGVNNGVDASTIRIDQSSAGGSDNLKSYNGRYTISLLDGSGNAVENLRIILMQNSTWVSQLGTSYDGVGKSTANVNLTDCFILISVQKNADFTTPVTVYPMLRLASDPDDTYVPYAMTNREITEELTVQKSAVTDIVSGASISNNHNNLYKQGKFVHMCIEMAHVTATAYDTVIAKVPSNFKPRAFAVDCNMSNTQIARIYVDDSGNVKSRNALSDASFVATATWITS